LKSIKEGVKKERGDKKETKKRKDTTNDMLARSVKDDGD
jgi:hypothetical protein